MSNARIWIQSLSGSVGATGITLALVIGDLLFNLIATASFKVSALSPNGRGSVTWQVVGNLAGFITLLTLTGLLRCIPLHPAFTVTTGPAVTGVQVAAAARLFREPIPRTNWIGAILIVLGIALVRRH
jgi:multidrug transporter EmrE-like cation transporter